MNPAHLHLAINHIPVIGLGAAILLSLYAVARKSDELKRATLAGFVLIALAAIPVFLSGKAAEEQVEHVAGVSEVIIEAHEEAAVTTLVGIEALGVVSLAGLLFSRRRVTALNLFGTVALAVSLVAGGLAAWTANFGGQIRHTEIRSGAAPSENNREVESDRHGGKPPDDR